jgi:hypothetical protein
MERQTRKGKRYACPPSSSYHRPDPETLRPNFGFIRLSCTSCLPSASSTAESAYDASIYANLRSLFTVYRTMSTLHSAFPSSLSPPHRDSVWLLSTIRERTWCLYLVKIKVTSHYPQQTGGPSYRLRPVKRLDQ